MVQGGACSNLAVLVQCLMKMEIKWFLCEKLQFLPLEVGGLLVQFNYDGSGFDLIHFHEGKTFCAGKPLFGFVVLEFKEDSCSFG